MNDTIRTFNRFELKYLLTLPEAARVRESLRRYLLPDPHGNGRYELASLYFDSPDLRFYSEKLDGVRVRRKLRIRHYESTAVLTDETPVFVEIKQRVDRVTQKRRAALTYSQALRFCSRRERPACAQQDEAVLEEVESMLWQYNLRPVSIVRYTRQAFFGTDYDPGLRVTFDTQLSTLIGSPRLHEPGLNLPLLPPDRVVMEVKVNDRLPAWMAELVANRNLQLVRLSKYCLSIEQGRNLPPSNWRVDAM